MPYPTLVQSYDSKEKRIGGRQLDRATNGTPKVRSFFSAEKKAWTLVHPDITAAEKATFEAFYSANSLTSFTFTWAADATSYTVLFDANEPTYTPRPGNRWTITVDLVQA